jgi:hypothetical protein
MQSIRKFMQGLVGALVLAIPVAVSAAPVTLRFAGEMQSAWPGAPVGTPFVVTYSFDPAVLVDKFPEASLGQYVNPDPSVFFGTVTFSAGSLVLTGRLVNIFVEDAAPGQDDLVDIYGSLDDGTNGAYAWIRSSGKDWLSGVSLPLDAAFFDGASHLVYETGIQSPEPNPYQDFTARVRAIPEPGSLALVCLALAAVAGSRRRHRPTQTLRHRG